MAAIMIQGCGSDVGKSTVVAGLCRLFANRGVNVRPFKPQNMSNNAAVTADGGEIGRAQALQAMACRTPATVDMNPVLLKPQSDTGAQVVVRGRVAGTWQARAYQERKGEMLAVVLECFARLQAESELVIVEGAGSPAEINLRAGDIANMGFARAANVPVILIGDIDRGHVIAALAGAHAVLEPADRDMIQGFIINKFRGDPSLFRDGRAEIVRRTGWRDIGMVPWLSSIRKLPAEDAVVLDPAANALTGKSVKIVVPMLSRMANFDDFDPLRSEPHVQFSFIRPGTPLPGDADLVVLPGTKATLGDLAFFRAQGWDIDLAAHVRRGGHVLGICGGFQMMGRSVADPEGVEGPPGSAAGLGLLDIETVLTGDKIVRPVSGKLADPEALFEGYEIHVGRTTGAGLARPFLFIDNAPDGAVSSDGHIVGTYVHGLFAGGEARAALLRKFGVPSQAENHGAEVDRLLDDIAKELERVLDIENLARIAGLS